MTTPKITVDYTVLDCPERTEEDVSMQVQEDRQFIDDYAERIRRDEDDAGRNESPS